MITIFSTLKPFEGHINIIQRNAIMSWKKLKGNPEIILLGNEFGVAEICKEFDLRHIPNIEVNEFGTPLCNDVFRKAQQIAIGSKIVYTNGDIILFDDFVEGVNRCATKFDHFLMIGQRYDLDIIRPIDFENNNWKDVLRFQVKRNGKIHKTCGIDYFVFRRGDWMDMPPFALGRVVWDLSFVYFALQKKHMVINATEFVFVVHQNHKYKKAEDGGIIQEGKEAMRNKELAKEKGVNIYKGFITNSTWKMLERGEIIKCR